MLLTLPDELVEKIFNYLDRNSLKKIIKAYPPLVRFERLWIKTHLRKVYVNKNGVRKWCTKYVPYND